MYSVLVIHRSVLSKDREWKARKAQIKNATVNPFLHTSSKLNYFNTDYGKWVPLQAWSGPECSRKLRFPDFMTTA